MQAKAKADEPTGLRTVKAKARSCEDSNPRSMTMTRRGEAPRTTRTTTTIEEQEDDEDFRGAGGVSWEPGTAGDGVTDAGGES